MSNEIRNEAKWTTARGTEIKVTSGLDLLKNINADGHIISVDCCEQTFRVEVNGKYHSTDGLDTRNFPRMVKGVKIYAELGRLHLTDPTDVARIQALVAKTESHPAWIAKQEKTEKNRKEVEDYDKHYDAVTKMMSY